MMDDNPLEIQVFLESLHRTGLPFVQVELHGIADQFQMTSFQVSQWPSSRFEAAKLAIAWRFRIMIS